MSAITSKYTLLQEHIIMNQNSNIVGINNYWSDLYIKYVFCQDYITFGVGWSSFDSNPTQQNYSNMNANKMPSIFPVSIVDINHYYINRSWHWMLDITSVCTVLTELLEVTKNANIVVVNA